MRDPYDILRVRRDATPEEIRDAFRRLAALHHPDKNPGDAGATARFAEISAAHDVLSDPAKRAELDGAVAPELDGSADAVNFLIGATAQAIGRARDTMGDQPLGAFAQKVGKAIVERASTPEGRDQLTAAGALLEQSLRSLLGT